MTFLIVGIWIIGTIVGSLLCAAVDSDPWTEDTYATFMLLNLCLWFVMIPFVLLYVAMKAVRND